jgi:hypothetical protein
MSPKLGMIKNDSVGEDRNWIGVEIDLETGDVYEEETFVDPAEAGRWVQDQVSRFGAGPVTTYGFMAASVFDSLED